jgi:hypothetical protein
MLTGLAIITFSAIVAAIVEVYLHKQRRLRRSQGSAKSKPTVEQIFAALKHENDD